MFMMTKKGKKRLIISSVIITLLIIAGILVYLYMTTDSFKTSAMLFQKYMGKNADNIESIFGLLEEGEYEKTLKENKYESKIQIKANYTEHIGTSSESTQNSINQLKIESEGKTDNSNEYNYQNIKILTDDQQAMNIEYIKENGLYGIRLPELFVQFVSIKEDKLNNLNNDTEINSDDIISSNSDEDNTQTTENSSLKDIITFTEEEKTNLQDKYLGLISKKFSKGSFSKSRNETIQINNESVVANGYVLKMTKEQLNDLYVEILTEMKQDEIILSKVDQIESFVKKYKIDSVEDYEITRENFIDDIDNEIEDIQSNNIGSDEVKIVVYEKNGATIRTKIETNENIIYFDWLKDKNYGELKNEKINTTQVDNKILTINKKDENVTIKYETKEDDDSLKVTFQNEKNIQGNNLKNNITLKYEDESQKAELDIEKSNKIVEKFENQISLEKVDNIKLGDLEENTAKEIFDTFSAGFLEKVNNVFETIKTDDITQMFQSIGLKKKVEKIEGDGITQIERERFNSKFEMLKAEKIKKEDALKTIETIQDNLISIEVPSDTEIKLQLDRNNKNDTAVTKIKQYIENAENDEYNVSIEYDDVGLVKYVILTFPKKD